MQIKFLEEWKNIDFSQWDEKEIKKNFIAPLLEFLGYGKGTIDEVFSEDHFTLRNSAIDHIPSARLKSFWIVDVKPGYQKEMDFGDFLQALYYAIHPENQARYMLLTNGWEIRIYDVHTAHNWNDALYVFDQNVDEADFAKLIDVLGRQNMLRSLRAEIIQNLGNSFSLELDENEVERFFDEINAKKSEFINRVRTNAEDEALENDRLELREIPLEELFELMNIPTNGLREVADEYYRRILKAEKNERVHLLDELIKRHRSRKKHSVFYVHSLHILLKLLQKGIEIESSEHEQGVLDTFIEFAKFNIQYGRPNEYIYCLLDNVCTRVGYKLAATCRTDYLLEIVHIEEGNIHTEQTNETNLIEHINPIITHTIELLWKEGLNHSKNALDIYKYIDTLKRYEEKIDDSFSTIKEQTDGDSLRFDEYGQSFDMLLMGTWNLLQRSKEFLKEKNVPKEIMDFAKLERNFVLNNIPKM